jgi:restriction endonuclease S subunit
LKIVKLGEVVDLFNGSTPLKTNKDFWVNGDVPWFTVDDLRKQGKYITHTEKFITKLGLKESSISLVPENAILLCCTASVGAIAINKIQLTTNQQFNALVVKDSEQLLVEYLYYWFIANMDILKSLGRATTIDYVSMSKLRDLTLQLPSLLEQREIVEKLELAFFELDLLEGNLEQSEEKASQLLGSILAASFTKSEITPERDHSLAGQGIATNWGEVSLKQICKVDWGNTKLTKSSYVKDGEFLAVSAAGADGHINHYEHEANVPVLSAIGAQCGRMFYPGARFTAIKNTITLTPKENIADGKFLYYLFSHVELPQRGAGQPFISKGDIEAFRVTIPENLEEQRAIVKKLDNAFDEIEKIKNQIAIKKDFAVMLRQSLLTESFSPQDEEVSA